MVDHHSFDQLWVSDSCLTRLQKIPFINCKMMADIVFNSLTLALPHLFLLIFDSTVCAEVSLEALKTSKYPKVNSSMCVTTATTQSGSFNKQFGKFHFN